MKEKYARKYLIETGIGLQDVDHLKNSDFFLNETNKYIKGEISLNELDQRINSYYESRPKPEDRSDEADKVSLRIPQIISDDSFTFTAGQLISIHKFLFNGLLEHPGQIRTYNFSKKEWVLDGKSVTYGDYRDLKTTLQYDFEQERKFDYRNLSIDEIIDHLSIFVSNLWQIHVFEEGNTRTVATFFIKYLRSLGFDVTNEIFAKNAWYFRNSLVRANYRDLSKGIYEDRSFLIRFLRNLLKGENIPLKNRELHIVSNTTPVDENSKDFKILSLIRSNPKITSNELANELGISTRTVKSILKLLIEKQTIKRVGGKRYGHWETK